jgi:peptidoglycan hydrolase-like protein with peptidoglycan-binding domain
MAVIRQPKFEKAQHAVSGAAQDNVYLSRCVVKNQFERKSLTIHHVQRRLAELGYRAATADKDGWYGDNTVSAVASFQSAVQLTSTGIIDAETFTALFAGDPNVIVHIDA